MSSFSDSPIRALADDVRQVAARWVVRIHEGLDEAETDAYLAWIQSSEENRTALRKAEQAWTAVGLLGSSSEMTAIRRQALNASRPLRLFRGLSSDRLKAAAAIAAVTVLGAGGGMAAWLNSSQQWTYAAGSNQGEVVTLPDQSTIHLDRGARVKVIYRPFARQLYLTNGQAEFDVAKNHSRPFSVEAAGERVVAVGTLFNVDLLAQRVIVTLVRGRVRVTEPSAAGAATIDLNPSERLVFDRTTGGLSKGHVDVADVEAWKMGKLVFDGEPLSGAIERVNRYAARKIVLSTRAYRDAPVSGVFQAGESTAFAEAVADQLSMRIEGPPRGDIVLARR